MHPIISITTITTKNTKHKKWYITDLKSKDLSILASSNAPRLMNINSYTYVNNKSERLCIGCARKKLIAYSSPYPIFE
jgi:hypothetical protein